MIRRFDRRHWLAALMFVIFIAGILFYRQPSYTNDSTAIPPARVLMKQAVVVGQGVQIQWIEARAGTHPITGYTLERSRDGGEFVRIARVEKISSNYLDAEGRAGDSYRVIAVGSHHPTLHSEASEPLIAAAARPGSVVVMAPPPHVGGTTTTPEQTQTPEARAALLENLITRLFLEFDEALAAHNFASARSHLNTLQLHQREVLSLWSHLSIAQRTSLAQVCIDQVGIFEANLHTLTEQDHMDGMLVLAGCQAIQEGVR